jgi:two-component system invasion response regulator UvrY
MEKVTILIVDDHTLVRECWKLILNTDPRFNVIAESTSGEEAIEIAKELRPDVVIMDINLPGMNGIEATHWIRRYSPGSRILGVSLHTQPAYARKMMQKGAMGYITKNSSYQEMIRAIVEVKNKRKYVCEEIRNILSDAMLNDDERDGFHSLSRREIEIIGYIKRGFSSKEISEALNISVKTVEVHRYNVLKKLHMKNAAAMVNYINNSQLNFTH